MLASGHNQVITTVRSPQLWYLHLVKPAIILAYIDGGGRAPGHAPYGGALVS